MQLAMQLGGTLSFDDLLTASGGGESDENVENWIMTAAT